MTIESFSAPIININGSSSDRLLEDILKAHHALSNAISAVAQTALHPRDWQTAADGDMLYRRARADHQRRLRYLQTIYNELEGIELSIQDQQDKRT